MATKPRRLRRCQLSVPGSSEKMLAKAAASGADFIFMDLEDAVAPAAKPEARKAIVKALNTLDFGRSTRCVRINDLNTGFAYDDIVDVVTGAGDKLDCIMLPKAMGPDHVAFMDRILTMLETKLGLPNRIGLDVLIEEVEAMQCVDEIAATAPDRLECLIFGMGDYAASQGIANKTIGEADGYPGDIWHYQRQRLTIACKVNGIDPVDGPSANFRDLDKYRHECRLAMILGMVGKWAIHPAQIAPATDVFSPDPDEVDRARRLMKTYQEAQEKGLGAVQFEGRMIDVASVRNVQGIIDKADLIEAHS